MRLSCNLRRLRGDRSLREVAALSGVSAGQLSQVEQGRLLPRDNQVKALERAYGYGEEDWYSMRSWIAIQEDDDGH